MKGRMVLNGEKERRKAPGIHEVALGALLHDIGKLHQRAGAGRSLPEAVLARAEDVLPVRDGRHSHWHALWSDAFFDWIEESGQPWPADVDPAWVRDLAVYHHNPLQAYRRNPALAATWLVTVADRAASGYERKARDEAEEADGTEAAGARDAFRRTPLKAIQTTIRLEERPAGRKGWFRPAPVSPESLMPEGSIPGEAVAQGYGELWGAFREGWADMARRASGDAGAFEEGVLSLLERFASTVPSSTVDQPDVSLHDHSHAVAAFASTLHAHHAARAELSNIEAIRDPRRRKLRFLVGDLSGLQRTLFRLKSEQVKGLNRILRGRSLRFQLIAEMAIRRILSRFSLPLSCALQNGGGRFLLLLPELPDEETTRRVDELRADFDEWLAGQYMGDLGLGLALSAPFATGDLAPLPEEEGRAEAIRRAGQVRADMRAAIETAKLRQLQAPAAGALFETAYPHGVCPTCGVRPACGEGPRCPACEAEHDLGQRLPRARAVILRLPAEEGGGRPGAAGDEILGGRLILALGEGREGEDGGIGWRFGPAATGPAPVRLNKPHVPVFTEEDMEKYRNLEAHEDIRPGDIKTFAALAHDSSREPDGICRGREMLAVLKADVDRLGAIFAEGLGPEWSIARQAALSRLMDGYFTMRLPWLLRERAPDIYTVYAGGDDLFLVGPWRAIFAFARTLHEDFSAFGGHNPSLTLSAGLALFDPRTPISIAANEAEARLEAAKDAGRNRISAIEAEPMAFGDYAAALDIAEKLDRWLQAEHIPSGGLYRLLAFDDARRRIASGHADAADYGWLARFGYHLARMLPKRTCDPVQEEIAATLCRLFGLDNSFAQQGRYKPGTRLAISHALYRNR